MTPDLLKDCYEVQLDFTQGGGSSYTFEQGEDGLEITAENYTDYKPIQAREAMSTDKGDQLRYFFSCVVKTAPHCTYVGIAPEVTDFRQCYFYESQPSFFFQVCHGAKLKDGVRTDGYCEGIESGDRCYVMVDMEKGEISLSTDTHNFGVAYQDESLKSGKWYPTFCLYEGVRVAV